MSALHRILLSLLIIFASLSTGYIAAHLAKGSTIWQNRLDNLRSRLQSISIFGLLPFSAMLSLWGLPNPSVDLLYLPFLGLVAYIFGGGIAILTATLMGMTRREAGSFYCCGTFTNLGAVGALVCLLYLGENSIALVVLYRLLEEIFYFGVCFPIARRYGEMAENARTRPIRIDPVLLSIVAALGFGIVLNLCGVKRADFLGPVASFSMLFATIFFLIAIGLRLRLSSLPRYWRAGVAMCVIKFVALPCVMTALAFFLGLGQIEGGLPLKVVCVLSAMPVAMTALVPPALFGLDVDLANSCWIYTTLGLVFVLPALSWALPML